MSTKPTNHSLTIFAAIAGVVIIFVFCLYWGRIHSNMEEKKLQREHAQLLNQINQLYIENQELAIQENYHTNKLNEIHGSAEENAQKIDQLWKEYYWDNEWHPGMLNKSWDAQEMPALISTTEHERFKELAGDYGLNAGTIWEVENFYGIKEWVILCITVAETSWGNRGAGGKNIGSVGSNDRGDRPTYALMEAGLEAIGKTLNNKYLWNTQTLGCLSNAGHCNEDITARYATSESSWEKNMVACLSSIYWKIDPATFSIRR